MSDKIQQTIKRVLDIEVSQDRKELLAPIVNYIIRNKATTTHLNFVCTHNSRRSQIAQVWAKVAADFYNLNVSSYSSGVEVTACHPNTIASFKRLGFQINTPSGSNPKYEVRFTENQDPVILFSKLVDEKSNPSQDFAAIMVCDHANETCPFITGCDVRIPLTYEDPKVFDNTPEESEMYDERSLQIASELFYVMSQASKQ